MNTLALISKLVARRDCIQRVIGWMDPAKPGYDRLCRSLRTESDRITTALADCAHELVAISPDDAPNLDGARATCEGAAPWYVDADVDATLRMQADCAQDWIAELING